MDKTTWRRWYGGRYGGTAHAEVGNDSQGRIFLACGRERRREGSEVTSFDLDPLAFRACAKCEDALADKGGFPVKRALAALGLAGLAFGAWRAGR